MRLATNTNASSRL